jgi:hypothetical protein
MNNNNGGSARFSFPFFLGESITFVAHASYDEDDEIS